MRLNVQELKSKAFLKFLLLLIFAAIVIHLGLFTDLWRELHPARLRELVLSKGTLAPLFFILIYLVIVITSIPVAPFAVFAGTVFGPVMGTIYVTISATLGAYITFFISRFLAREWVQNFLKKYWPAADKYSEKLEKKGFETVLLLRLLIFLPFNELNMALGVSKVRVRDYLLATAIGIIPGSLLYVFFGSILIELEWGKIVIAVIIFVLVLFGLRKVLIRNGGE